MNIRAARRLLLCLLLACAATPLLAQNVTFTSVQSGPWDDPNTWDVGGGQFPGDGSFHHVVIASGHTVTVANSALAADLTFTGSGSSRSVVVNAGQFLTVNGAVTFNDPLNPGVTNTLNVGSGDATVGSVTLTGGTGISSISQLSIGTGTLTVNGGVTITGFNSNAQITFTGAGTLDLSGSLNNGGTLTNFTGAPGSLIRYSGTGAQTVGAYSYQRLTLNKTSGTATVGGTVDVAGAFTQSGGTFDLLLTTCTLSGLADINGAINGTGGLHFAGALASLSGTGNIAAPVTLFTSKNISNGSALTFNSISLLSGVTMTNAGVTTVGSITGTDASSTWTNNGTLKISGSLMTAAGTLDGSNIANTVEYTGASQTVKPATFYATLSLKGSGAVSVSGVTNILADFNVGGTTLATMSGSTAIGGSVNIGPTASLSLGAFTHSIAGNWTNNGALNAGTSTVHFSGSSAQNINNGTAAFYNIQFSGVGLKSSPVAGLDVDNDFSISVGSNFDGGSLTHKVGGNWLNSGTFSYGTSTIDFDGGAGSQTINNSSFYNVTFSNAGPKTASGILAIQGSVTINSGATFNAGGVTHLVDGNWTNNGTFNGGGGTISFEGSSAQSIGASSFNNVLFTNPGLKTFTGALNIGGTLTINAGASVNAGTGLNVLSGNLTNDGTLTNSGNTWTLNGATQQTISGTAPVTFANLTITNLNGLALSQHIQVSNVLNIGTSVITTNAFAVVMSGGSSLTRTTGWIYGEEKHKNATGFRTFDVGTLTSYSPVSMQITGTADTAVLAQSGTGCCTFGGANHLNQSWQLFAASPITADLTFTWPSPVAGNETNYVLGKYQAATWSYPGGTVTPATHSGTVTAQAINATPAAWTAGEPASLGGAPPTVDSFNPTAGSQGVTVILTGTNFSGATAVAFNATPATFVVDSATQITTSVPAGATTGTISVTTADGTGTSAASFTVNAPGLIQSAASGTWTTPATWVGNIPPGTLDTVQINATHTVTLTASATCAGLTVSSTGSVNVGTSTLTVNGAATIDGPVTGSGSLTLTGTANLDGSGTFAPQVTVQGSRTVLNTANLAFNGGMTVSGGAILTNNGQVHADTAAGILGSGSFVNSNNATLSVGGPMAPTLTATASGNSVDYNGGAQTVQAAAYHYLFLSGSGAKTMTGVSSIGADLSISGSAAVTAGANMTIGGSLNVFSGSASLSLGSFTHNVAGNWTNNGTVNAAGSVVNFNGNSAQSIDRGSASFDGVTFNGSGTKSMTGAGLLTTGTVNINGGATFDGGSFTHQIGGSWNNTGTFLTGASTVELVSATPASVRGTFNNLKINKPSGTATLALAVTVDSSVILASGTLDQGGNNLTALSVTGPGALTLSGGTLLLGGNSNFFTGTFTPGTGTVTVNGAGTQSLRGGTYYNLTIAKTSGTALLSAPTTATNMLWVASGTLSDDGNQISGGAGSTLQVDNGATLSLGSGALSTSFPGGFTTNTFATGSDVLYAAANSAQQIASFPNYGWLTIDSGGGIGIVKTVDGGGVINCVRLDPTNSGGTLTLDLAGKTANVSGNLGGNAAISFGASTGAINLGGDFVNTGTFTRGLSTVTYNGTGNQQVRGLSYHNLNVNKIAGNAQLTGAATVFGNLTITNGSLQGVTQNLTVEGTTFNSGSIDAGSGIWKFRGNVTNNSVFTGSTGSIVLDGGAAQSWSGSIVATLNNLQMANLSGLTLNKSVSVGGTLDLADGIINVALTEALTVSSATVTRTAGYVIGPLTMNLPNATTRTFHVGTATGYAPVDILPSGSGLTTVTAKQGPHPNAMTASILQRYWTIGTAIPTATLQLNWNAAEAVGTESAYVIGRYNAGWTQPGGVVNSTLHFAQIGGAALAGDWTAGEPSAFSGVADLSTAVTSVPPSVLFNQAYSYSVAVNNAGPDPATGVTVSMTLTGDATVTGATAAGWTCGNTATTATCTLATLATGAPQTITVNTTANASGSSASLAASVTATSTDANAANNNSSAFTSVGPLQAELALTHVRGGPATVNPSTLVTFNLSVTNNGTSTATNVSITDVLPSGLSYVSNTASGLTCGPVGFNVVCTAPTLGVGNTATASITVNAVTGGTLTATASVSATEADPNTANNSASASVTVVNVSTLTVESNADSGNFTLRQAILDANSGACVVPCSILFNLPGGQHVISPTSPLPALTARMFLQATTQPGYSGVPIVELDGTSAGGIGLQLTASGSQVRGFVIRNFPNAGVLIAGNNALVADNYIGTNLAGTAAAPNTDGVRMTAGLSAVQHNLISGNSASGISLIGAAATGNSVSDNIIGLNASGTAALGNGLDGVQLLNGANNNVVGDSALPNTISANARAGVFLDSTGVPTSDNAIYNNRIGSNLAGNFSIGNGTAAVVIDNNAPANVVGVPSFGNVVVGSPYGIKILSAGSDGNKIQGNYIGTDITGAMNLGNGNGVYLAPGPVGTIIGGTATGEGNTIAFNGAGVTILGSFSNPILTNSFYGSTSIGIDLDGDLALNPNDPGDSDTGSNNGQNYPQLVSANVAGGTVTLTLQLESSGVVGTQSLLVEAFKAQGSEGKSFLSRQCYATNNPGTATLTFPSALVSIGDPIVATATSYQDAACGGAVNDGTSEFSNVVNVACVPPTALINHAASVCPSSTSNVATAGGGASSYVWGVTNGTLTAGQGTPSITYTAGTTGSVNITLTVSNGTCSSSTSSNVPIAGAITAPTITGPSAACPSQPFVLDAGPGYASYSWSNGVTTVGSGQTLTVSQTSTTTYTVTVTSGSCSAQSSKTVTMTTPPAVTITAGGPTTFCAPGSVTLDAGGGFVSYLWSTGATTQSITVTASGSYFVTVSNGTCNATSTPVSVTATPQPNATISAPASACPNATGVAASVPPTAGATYAWTIGNGTITSGQGTASITFSTTAASPVSLSVTVTAGGCSNSGSALLSVTPIATPVITGPTASCSNSTIALTATPGYATYSWSDGFQIVGTSPSIAVQPVVDTTYTLVVSSAGGCTSSATHSVTVTTAGPVTITAPSNVNPGSTNNSASVPPRPAGTTFTWTASGGAITAGQGTNAITFSAGSGSSVLLGVTVVTSGCTSTGSRTVTIGQSAELVISKTANVATAGAGSNVTFTIGVNNNGPNASGTLTVTEALPPGTTLVSADGSGWSFTTLNANTVSASHAGLSSGAAAPPITVVLSMPNAAGPVTNVASVSGSVRDPFVGNNTATATVNVGGSNPNCPTTPAQLMTPAADAVNVASPVSFNWTPVAGAASYELWLSVDNGGAQLVASTSATSTVQNVPGGTINWFVIARFTSGCAPLISESSSFTVARSGDACAGNTSATLIAPANNSVASNSLIDFQWTSVAGADGYRLWARIDGGAPQVLAETGDTASRQLIPNGRVEWWIETRFPGCPSIDSQHFVVTVPEAQNCNVEQRPELLAPAADITTSGGVITFQWSGVPNAIKYELWLGLDGASPSLAGATTATSLTREVPAGRVDWFVRAFVDRCDPRDSARRRFTYAPPAGCPQLRPLLSSPAENAVVFSPFDFRWSTVSGGTSYKLIVIKADGTEQLLPSGNGVSLDPGAYSWVVEVSSDGCSPLRSAPSRFAVRPKPAGCPTPGKPALRGPSSVSSNVPYTVRWSQALGATSYVIQESANAQFSPATTRSTASTEAAFQHGAVGDQPQAFYYRVRGISDCSESEGQFSAIVAVFILPQTDALEGAALADEKPPTIGYQLPLDPILAGQSFTATASEPWLAVTPSSGVIPPGGLVLNVSATTATLPLGTSLGSISITINGGKATAHATSATGKKTVTVNLVQPVAPGAKDTPPPDSLIIPAVAHADGVNSKFQSDVRVSNTSAQVMKYSVIFTPSGEDGPQAAQTTTITIDPGQTIALDDVLRTWFGSGNTSSSTGTLEVRPLTTTKATPSVGAVLSTLPSLTTFAASRTFNATANGTFGQYIPGIPYASFIGKGTDLLSLQQIAQSSAYRTNLGLVEGSGQPASLLIAVFGANGQKLTEFPIDLKGGQHLQLNSFLLSKNIELQDGRIEVRVTSPGGKVTAYASVLDQKTADPMLVTPVSLSETGHSKFVVPGVADLSTGAANWRTDMRVFNASSNAVEADLSFYSQTGGEPRTAHLSLAPNEVRQLDNTLSSIFGITNDGGALHITTTSNVNLVATARTYNQTTGGTYGQFISAVTPDEAVGNGDRALELLQVEESDRYRSNIGIAEVSGKAVKVRISVTPPDSKVTASTDIDLGPNAFKQLPSLLKAIGYDGTYNARVSVKVIEGEGRITAYASVIDAITQDPTYVGAQ